MKFTYSQLSQLGAQSNEPEREAPPIATHSGRGVFSLLKATEKVQTVGRESLKEETVKQVSTSVSKLSISETYPKPILEHKENPPVVKRGEKGQKYVTLFRNCQLV